MAVLADTAQEDRLRRFVGRVAGLARDGPVLPAAAMLAQVSPRLGLVLEKDQLAGVRHHPETRRCLPMINPGGQPAPQGQRQNAHKKIDVLLHARHDCASTPPIRQPI